ncbi:MAG: transporter [Dehalococcoidia bacterium]|nr:transporter [Dehalococcoidia bacterium]
MQFFTRTFVSLKYRDFRFLLLSSLGLGMGQWFQQIGMGFLVYEATGQAKQLAFIYTLRGITALVAAPIGGVLSDRFNRRLVIIVATMGSATQATVLAFLVLNNMAMVWHLYAFIILEAMFNSINQPARMAFVYDVNTRETATNAYSLNAIVQNFSRIMGPNLAGVVIGVFGVGYCFIALAVMKVTSTLFTVMIASSAGRSRVRKSESYVKTFVEGIRYALTDHVILAILFIHSAKQLLIMPYVGYMPVFAKDVFYAPERGSAGWATGISFLDGMVGRGWAAGYGLIASGLAFGSIPGALLIAYLGNFKGRGKTMIIGILGYMVMVFLFTRMDFIWWGWACLLIAGVFFVIATTLTNTLLQLWSRDDMRGRVMALQAMEQGLTPLGSLPMGFAIDRFGPQNTVGAFASAAALTTIVIALIAPQIRREPPSEMEEEPAPAEERKLAAVAEREPAAVMPMLDAEPVLEQNGATAPRRGFVWFSSSVLVAAGVYIATRYIRNRNNGTNHSTTPSYNRRAQGRGGKSAAEANGIPSIPSIWRNLANGGLFNRHNGANDKASPGHFPRNGQEVRSMLSSLFKRPKGR